MAKRVAPETPEADASTAEKPAKAPRAPKAEKAEKAPKPEKAEGTEEGEKATRRNFGRGWLAQEVETLCRKHAAGTKIKGVEAGAPLTVGVLQGIITNSAGEPPSTGAISAVLMRWIEDSYIKTSGKPLAFIAYTAKYKDSSLEKFLEDRKARIAKEKAAAKKAA